MIKAKLVLAAVLLPVVVGGAQAAQVCGVEVADPGAWFAELSAPRPDRVAETDKLVSVRVETPELVIWTVTKDGHPAHPAMACRHPYKAANGEWKLEFFSNCANPSDACKAFQSAFEKSITADQELFKTEQKLNPIPLGL